MKPDPVLARLAAMKAAPVAELKKQWRELFSEDGLDALARELQVPELEEAA